MTLSDYLTAVRDMLHDDLGNFYSTAKLTRWINRARHQVAQKAYCVRAMPPGTASLSSVTVTASGSGYTTATVEVGEPDAAQGGTQAVVSATVAGGMITGFVVSTAGTGYVAVPDITITGDGTGATGLAVLSAHTATVVDQEVYDLADVATIMDGLTSGLGELIGVQSIAVSWGSIKPVLDYLDFSGFQAWMRAWSVNYQNRPLVWTQYGQGATGSIYIFPKPSEALEMEWDCYFDVLDLSVSQTTELIPTPWSEPVIYYACYLAYLNAQRTDDARGMLAEHERLMQQGRVSVQPARVPSFYPDGLGG